MPQRQTCSSPTTDVPASLATEELTVSGIHSNVSDCRAMGRDLLAALPDPPRVCSFISQNFAK